MSSVTAIVPAHNEEEQIGQALDHIMAQTVRPAHVIVALDNCTDGTEDIVKSYDGVNCFHTVDNTAKKAGALNQAVEYMLIHYGEPEFILQIDADSYLDSDFVAEGLAEMSANKDLGGVCGRFHLRSYTGGNKLLHSLQDIEYSLADSIRVQDRMSTGVLSGTGCLLRWDAIKSTCPYIWNESSIVEDYRLSLDLKRKGSEIRFGEHMFLETDYMPTLKSLWAQRRRWVHGTTEELIQEGWKPHTKKEILTQIQGGLMGGLTILFLIYMGVLLSFNAIEEWHPLGQVMLAVTLADRLYRSKYIRDKSVGKMILHLSFVVPFVYYLFWIACFYYATIRAATRKPLKAW